MGNRMASVLQILPARTQVLRESLKIPQPPAKENLEGLKHEVMQTKVCCNLCGQHWLNKRQDLEGLTCPGISLYGPVQ
eukprot:7820199-Karenia_brevis.AAC.1